MKRHPYPSQDPLYPSYRSPSPLLTKQKLPKRDPSTSKSPNPFRRPQEAFNPLSPDNIDYLVTKHLSDSNSKEPPQNSKVSFESNVYYDPNRSGYQYAVREPVLQENINVNRTSNPSKAYVNAMKALQVKIKSLEEENKQIVRISEEREKVKDDDIQGLEKEIIEKAKVFEGLERNLKEKLSIIERERNDYERKYISLQKECERLKGDQSTLERKYEDEFKSYLNEKSEIKAVLKLKEDKLELFERENRDLKSEIEELRRGKQGMELDLLSGSEETKKLIQELKEKLSLMQKERDENVREWTQKENEYKRQCELEKSEKNVLGRELNEMRLLNEKTEGVLAETKYQINQKENELLLLREKVKNLIKEKENSARLTENKPQILRKKDLYRISEEGEKNRDSLEENFNKGNLKQHNNRGFENQTQRTLNTVSSDEENLNQNPREQRNVRMRLFDNNQNEERLDKDYHLYANKGKQQKNVKYDVESVVANIIQLERELIKYIEKYKFLSSRLAVIFFFLQFYFVLNL